MTSPNLEAIRRWRDEVEARNDPMWVCECDRLVTTLFTVDSELEDTTVWRMCLADRYHATCRPATRAGITRFDLDAGVERFVANESTCREMASILAHNRIHGLLRRASEREGERF